MVQLAWLLAGAWLLSTAASVRVGCRPCEGEHDSAAALAQLPPWRSWVPPAPNAPITPCGCGGGASARLTDRETLRAMSDSELIALAGKLEKENQQLAGKLAEQKQKDGVALGKLQAKMKKMQDGGKKLDSSATKQAAARLADRTDTSDSLESDEAKIAEIQDSLTKAKKDMTEARSEFDAVWDAQRSCACKKGASMLSARQLISGDPGMEHSKKIMKVQDLERKRSDLKESIDNAVLKFSADQRRLMDRMDDMGVTLNLKSRKAKAAKRMDKAHEKILAHQVAAVKRYKDNLTKQLTSRIADVNAVKKKTQELRDEIRRCGCAPKR